MPHPPSLKREAGKNPLRAPPDKLHRRLPADAYRAGSKTLGEKLSAIG